MAHPTKPRALAPWDRPEPPSRFTVEETAIRVGRYQWLEMQIFEVLGGWVASVPELDVKHRLGTHCYHHAFHAELWHRRLPELGGMAPERLTRAPNPEMEEFIEALGGPEGEHRTIEKLVGFYRVLLPHLIAAYTYHVNNASQLTDAPTVRSLGFCLQDDIEEWREGEMMLQWLVGDPAEVDRAVAHQAELTKLMMVAGGVVGPGSVGAPDGEDRDL